MDLLKGKTAIVTGAARGIGKGISLKLASAGCSLGLCDLDEKSLAPVCQEIEREGGSAFAFKCDVSSYEAVNSIFPEVIEKLGRIDILVNNAGITRDNLLMRMSPEEWDQVIKVNLYSGFNTCRAVIRKMLKQKSGSIINISSVIGIIGNKGQTNYSASKAGLIGLTKSLAREVASRGIRVNAIAPGFIQTDMTERLGEEVKKSILQNTPLGRIGTPEDIANAVLFLGSDMSRFITGQVICVDGGMVM